MQTQSSQEKTVLTGNRNGLGSAADQRSKQAERAYRDALGQFGTGVALVTTVTETGPIGMTVNSFASVSLDPALVLWSVANKSERSESFRNAANFAIQVLGEDQFDLAMAFATNADKFEKSKWHMGKGNIPLANNALAHFECTMENVHDGGDHSILVGRVVRFSTSEGRPLIFANGKFGGFTHTDFHKGGDETEAGTSDE